MVIQNSGEANDDHWLVYFLFIEKLLGPLLRTLLAL